MREVAARAAWRACEDVLLPSLWGHLTGRAAGPGDDPGQLAGLLGLARQDPGFAALGRALLEVGGPHAFQAAWSPIQARLPALGHHHLAVLWTREGWLCAKEDPARALQRWQRAQRHFWRALGASGFVEQLAADCGATDRAAFLAREAPAWILEPHAQTLQEALVGSQGDMRELEAHWRALSEAPALAGEVEAHAVKATLEAEVARWRTALAEQALGQAQEQARGVEPTSAPLEALEAPFRTLERAVRLFGPQEELSIWVLDKSVEWMWPLYKLKAEATLRALLALTKPFVFHVEALLRRGAGAFGRQSLCADYWLFVADDEPKDAQLWLQRALDVCPGHRNARLMLSYHWLSQAHLALVKCEGPNTPLLAYVQISDDPAVEAWKEAKRHIDEAARLLPENPRLPDYHARLNAAALRLKLPLPTPPGA